MPKCHKCHQDIASRIVTAMGNTYHPEHFTCSVCDEPIGDTSFNQKDGKPVCSNCYQQKYSTYCCSCNQPIENTVVKALGKSWHSEHFLCNGPCKMPLSGTSFYERDGHAYCKHDFEQIFAARCAGCQLPISDKSVIALDAKWHKDCFKCQMCAKPISGSTFAVENNLPVCTKCVK